MIVFGPIPSRRLGRSLGINNIPPKVCSYSCVYCQVGNTDTMSIKRKEFFSTDQIFSEVSEKLNILKKSGEIIDYLTFVPDGEPTLDINLGMSIKKLKSFGIDIAVITNSSLVWNDDVKNDLMNADLVSLKIDTVFQNAWRKINRPHGSLNLHMIIEGVKNFTNHYCGTLITETMLVKGINDSVESMYKTAEFIKQIHPLKAYILVPTRPPAEASAKAPEGNVLAAAIQIFSSIIGSVELLAENEGTNFSFSSDAEKELLSILAVHPMRKDAVEDFLLHSKTPWSLVDDLIKNNLLKKVVYSKDTFFIKNIER